MCILRAHGLRYLLPLSRRDFSVSLPEQQVFFLVPDDSRDLCGEPSHKPNIFVTITFTESRHQSATVNGKVRSVYYAVPSDRELEFLFRLAVQPHCLVKIMARQNCVTGFAQMSKKHIVSGYVRSGVRRSESG